MALTENLPSPNLFRRWAAVSAISCVLERKFWTAPLGPPLYTNTYIILCGPAGVGKTTVTAQVQRLLREIKDVHSASSSLTKASLIDELTLARRSFVRATETPSHIEYNFLSIVANELGVLIPAYDSDFMSALTDIWDGLGYSERRRASKIEIKLPAAQFNLLTGTTPSYLSGTLPPGAWDQGFLSRTTVVFSGETQIRPIFEDKEQVSKDIFDNLVSDLKDISAIWGKANFTPDAVSLFRDWHMAGGPPAPEHPKLLTYATRRTAHLAKLCLIMSASERSDRLVTEEHFIQALDLMTLTETYMPDIFKAMTANGDGRAIEECWYFAMQAFSKEAKPIAEGRLVAFLAERVPAHSVTRILEVMAKMNILKEEALPGIGRCYKPMPKR